MFSIVTQAVCYYLLIFLFVFLLFLFIFKFYNMSKNGKCLSQATSALQIFIFSEKSEQLNTVK